MVRSFPLLLISFAAFNPVIAQWTLVHPESPTRITGPFLNASGTRVHADNRLGVIDWTAGTVESRGGEQLPPNVSPYGENSAWLWSRMTHIKFGGIASYEIDLYHVANLSDLENPDVTLEDFRVALPEHETNLPDNLLQVSDSGDYFLFEFPENEGGSYYDLNRQLFRYDGDSGWEWIPLNDGYLYRIGGTQPPDLFAYVWREFQIDVLDTLYQVTPDGFVELAVLEPELRDPVPAVYGAMSIFRASPPPISYPWQLPPDTLPYTSGYGLPMPVGSLVYVSLRGLYIYDRETGLVDYRDRFPSGKAVFTGQESETGKVLVNSFGTLGYYDFATKIFEPIEDSIGRCEEVWDIVYDKETAQWVFSYNSASLARTADFVTFEDINPSAFSEQVEDFDVVGDTVYAVTANRLLAWDKAGEWQSEFLAFGINFTSILYHDGTFVIGGFGGVLSTTDFQTVELHESNAFRTVVSMDIDEGKLIPIKGRAPVRLLGYYHNAYWGTLQSSIPFYGPVSTVVYSTDLSHWTALGEWMDTVVGYSAENSFLLMGSPDAVYRIDTRTRQVAELPFPDGYTGRLTSHGVSVAGLEDEILAICEDANGTLVLLRHRPETGWVHTGSDLNGEDLVFTGLTDRYHLKLTDFTHETYAAETVHGDWITRTGKDQDFHNPVLFNGNLLSAGAFNTIWRRTLSEMDALLPDNQDLGDGWWYQDELGFLYSKSLPWVFSVNHGWLFFSNDLPAGWRMYDAEYGWLQTSESLYPLFYSSREGNWLRYQPGSKTPDRWFYHYAAGRWQSESGD